MSDLHLAFVSKSFLRSHWDLEYPAWHDSENERALDDRLALWAKRTDPYGGSSLGAIPYRARQAADVQESHTARRDKLVSLAVLATIFSITQRTAGKKLSDALRKLATNSSVVSQIMAPEREQDSLEAEIARQEREMNALVYPLHSLSAEEIEMVAKG